MKRIVIVALLLLCNSFVHAEQATAESIKKFLNITGKIQSHEEMIREYFLPVLKKNMPAASDSFVKKALQSEFDSGSFIDKLIPEYQKNFTQEEINAYIDFFQTPAGKKFLAKEVELKISSDVQSEMWLQQVAQNIYLKYKEKYGK